MMTVYRLMSFSDTWTNTESDDSVQTDVILRYPEEEKNGPLTQVVVCVKNLAIFLNRMSLHSPSTLLVVVGPKSKILSR